MLPSEPSHPVDANYRPPHPGIGHFLSSLHPVLLLACIIVICIITAEAGYLIALSRFGSAGRTGQSASGTAVGAMLGLLAFMLGFTFSITSSRFSARKEAIILQANAIGTCYLRTSFLPDLQKKEIRKHLKEYIEVLLQFHSTESIVKSLGRIEELQSLIWKQTASLAHESMDPLLRSIFTVSVNEVFDITARRKTVGLIHKIPDLLWGCLLFIITMCMFTFGYYSGVIGTHPFLPISLMSSAFGIVVVLISSMDSLDLRYFSISQKPLEDVGRMMQMDIP